MHLDLCKKTGDKFTADEFNQIISAINAKVEQEAGKALSDENFTSEEKQFLATLATKNIVKMITDEVTRATEAEGTLSSSISKLSKDFTDFISDTADSDNVINRFHEIVAFLSGIAETDTLEGMFSEMTSSVNQSITTAISDFEVKIKLFISQTYQPKESGKGLSANDYTTTEKEKLAGLPTGTQITQNLASKVDKVEGKQLSTEDFTTVLKNKLEGLSNYNDAEVKKNIASLQSTINTLVNENPNEVIDSFNEVKKFLEGVTDTENLAAMLAALESKITAKIPTKLSQLSNDGNFVQDTNYVHTDNNFTTEDKEKLAGLTNYDDTAITKSINDEITRSKAAEAALSGKLDELSKVALADVGYFAIEYGDEEDSSQAVRSAVTYYMQKVTEGGQTVKPNWSIHKVSDKNMVDFLGVRIGTTHRKLRKRNRKEIESRLSELKCSSDFFECERSWARMNGSFKNINMSNLINYWKDVYPDFFDRLQWAKTAHASAAAYKRKHRKMEIELQSAKDCRTYKIPFFGNAGFNPDGTMAVLFRTIGQHKRC